MEKDANGIEVVRIPGESKSANDKEAMLKMTNGIHQRKKTLGQKFASTISSDGKSIGDYIVETVIRPSINDLISNLVHDILDTLGNAVKGGIDMALYGEEKPTRNGRRNRYDITDHYTSYDSYYGSSRRISGSDRNTVRTSISRHRSVYDYKDDIFDTRKVADAVLEKLYDILEKDYPYVTVADYYECCSQVGDIYGFTYNRVPTSLDSNYGWKTLKNVEIRRDRGDWIIDLPDAQPIK